MPVEKISMEKERMLLKFAPKDAENIPLEVLTKTQDLAKDDKQDQIPQQVPAKVSNVGEVTDESSGENNIMSPINFPSSLNFCQSYDKL